MKLAGLGWSEVQELIADFLASGQKIELPASFDKDEAIRRARELLADIVEGKTPPAEIRVDEDLKRVAYALVYGLLRDGKGGESRHARLVYEFIRDLNWTDDVFGEKEELLGDCVAAARMHTGVHVKRIPIETIPKTGDSDVSKASAASKPGPERARVSEQELREIFQEHITLARAFLLDHYGVGEPDEALLEQDVLRWFLRIARRSETPLQNPRGLLLAACSEVGRAYERVGSARGRAISAKTEPKAARKPRDH